MTIEYGLATSDQLPAIEALLRSNDWDVKNLDEGELFVARDDDEVIGVVHQLEVADCVFSIGSALLHEDRRGNGIGAELMRFAMAGRSGSFSLACHDPRVAFYERLGYSVIEEADLPPTARDYAHRSGDLPNQPDHRHHLMRRLGKVA